MNMTFAQMFSPAAQTPASVPAPGTTTPAAVSTPADPFPKSATPDPVVQQTAPLEPFKDLFTVDPKATVEDPNAPFITYDKAQLNEAVGKMNFMEGDGMMELATKATGGDTAALITLINASAQAAYAKGAELSANVANRAGHGVLDRNQNKLPEQMRTTLAQDALAQLNPALNHPALAIQTQQALAAFSQKFPTATPAELAKQVNEYFIAAYKAAQTPETTNQRQPNPSNPGSQDFTDFFGSSRRQNS